jgi:hypothetical protein
VKKFRNYTGFGRIKAQINFEKTLKSARISPIGREIPRQGRADFAA